MHPHKRSDCCSCCCCCYCCLGKNFLRSSFNQHRFCVARFLLIRNPHKRSDCCSCCCCWGKRPRILFTADNTWTKADCETTYQQWCACYTTCYTTLTTTTTLQHYKTLQNNINNNNNITALQNITKQH